MTTVRCGLLWSDIFENEEAVTIKAELPGVDPQSVDIRFENNVLTLKGERKFDGDAEKENVLRMERPYGNFSRSFPRSIPPETFPLNARATLIR